MDEVMKYKLKALGKVGYGLFRIGGGVLTAAGHGIIGSRLRSRNLMNSARQLGRASVLGGKKMLTEGLNELKH